MVTGAANGIGRGFAEGLARRGLSLRLIDIDHVGLAATAKSIREAWGRLWRPCLQICP